MSIYHCSIKIVSRAGGRSAVASAAYRAGEKLYNEETGLTHDFTHKGGVVMNEVILPDNAPRRYLNREVLWNEVQQIEKRSDAQFAREIEVALPNEMTREQQIECVRKSRLFPVTKAYLHHEMDRGSSEAGVKRIRIHDLRHSSCAMLIHLGYAPIQIAERLGRESSVITERYSHLYPSVQRDMADRLNQEFPTEGI